MQASLPIIEPSQQREYYFGPQGFKLFATMEEIAEANSGLALLHDLPLPEHTQSWQVVAQDTELGDPYFIDESDFTGAVYTTIPGNWTKILVATSVSKFLESLAFLEDTAEQKGPQYIPDNVSISDEKVLAEMELLLGKLSGAEAFWCDFFAGYLDWLLDDGSDDEFDEQYPEE